jgi:repressor LexA
LTKPPAQGRTVPIVGQIAAGKPALSSDRSDTEMLVPVEFLPNGQAFIVRVSGDSMEGVGILPNDLVVAKVANSAERGSIVVVTLGDESTLKFLDRRKGRWWLVSANPRYPPLEIQSPAIVQGVATAVLRKIEPNATAVRGWLLHGTNSRGGSK